MRSYAIVEPTIWTGRTGRDWRQKGREFQVLGFYLQTCPNANAYGLYYLPLVAIAEETGVPPKQIRTVFDYFRETDYARYDYELEWVFVVNMAQKQLGTHGAALHQSDKRVLGLQKWYRNCPRNPFLGEFYDRYCIQFYLADRRGSDPPPRPASENSNNGALETFRPSGGAVEPSTRGRRLPHDYDPLFEQWWSVYPKKHAKVAAYREWSGLRPKPDQAWVDRAIATLRRQMRDPQWLKDNGQYIPDPERYLKKGRFADEQTTLPTLSQNEATTLGTLIDWQPPGEPR